MTNERCRAILLLIQKLHEVGFGGLRFMPTLSEHNWSIDVGPREIFSFRDGSFVPYDLRHRLVRFSGLGDVTPLDGSPLDVLENAFYTSGPGAQLGRDAEAPFDLFKAQCDLQDDEYCMWLKNLRACIDNKSDAFPNREEKESSALEKSVFYVSYRSFQGGGSLNMAFPAPPPGKHQKIRSVEKKQCYGCGGTGGSFLQELGNCPTCNTKGSIKREESCPDCNGAGLRMLESSSGVCKKCKGNGWIKKPKCDEELCPECNGDGTRKIESWAACTTCKGKGLVEKEEQCPDCNGDGTLMIKDWASCKKCNGKGHTVRIIEHHEELQRCEYCDGQYLVPIYEECWRCKGLGYIVANWESPDRDKHCYECDGSGLLNTGLMETCRNCYGEGYVSTQISVDITPKPRSR